MSAIDYDRIAATYDRRYLKNDYSGVERAVADFVGRRPDARVLEVGCGTGHWLRFLAESGIRAVGLDASAGMLARAQAHDRRSALVRGDAGRLPFIDGTFDRLFCVNALHHFPDKPAFFVEARRLLRRGGRVMTIGLDPHAGIDRWYIYDYFETVLEMDRKRYAGARQIREWMEAAGFANCVTREVQHLPSKLPAREAIDQGRLDRTATSQLGMLTDEQYQRGLDRIRREIESAEADDRILYLSADLRLYATIGEVPSR